MKELIIERLIRYAKVDTQSNEEKTITPTTPGQLELGRILVEELKTIGLTDAEMDGNGYVMATLPATTEKDVPTIGFLAHVDTATDFTGKNVNPQRIDNYSGEDIILNAEKGIVMTTKDFPELTNYKGHTLITTDGTTLLGADNKAGIAEIMTAMEYLANHPEIEHGTIRVAFTPDEEIGRGPHKFDVERFGAEFAYTIDGGPLGELQYESFNACGARLTVRGKNVHPGTAKGKMINAGRIAAEFVSKLPEHEVPEMTSGYEGFFHLISIAGDVEEAKVYLIIRDHDRSNFEARKELIRTFTDELKTKYGSEILELDMADQYYNMGEKIEPVKYIVDIARESMESLNIKPIIEPIRGGTDGSQLSFMGLPTPNIFTGGENFHGKYEFASADDMEKSSQVIIEIAKRFAARV
ncbi:peptidase T [Aciduricibacillus chroicocephali]|uniref:Peptidase T n=1 Tax=Aciduricibacillus chroicocephali TaxID=3054939 RepID=A0ABY9KWC5_9BACI|nr:peptidase T [Bacillaceae bacterium 44XB]